jgi:4-oxalocrotonate tautomerase family enzyme
MPVIQITMGKSTQEQKRALVERITADAVEITKISPDHFTVLIHELERDNIGNAGKTQTDIFAAMNKG